MWGDKARKFFIFILNEVLSILSFVCCANVLNKLFSLRFVSVRKFNYLLAQIQFTWSVLLCICSMIFMLCQLIDTILTVLVNNSSPFLFIPSLKIHVIHPSIPEKQGKVSCALSVNQVCSARAEVLRTWLIMYDEEIFTESWRHNCVAFIINNNFHLRWWFFMLLMNWNELGVTDALSELIISILKRSVFFVF